MLNHMTSDINKGLDIINELITLPFKFKDEFHFILLHQKLLLLTLLFFKVLRSSKKREEKERREEVNCFKNGPLERLPWLH